MVGATKFVILNRRFPRFAEKVPSASRALTRPLVHTLADWNGVKGMSHSFRIPRIFCEWRQPPGLSRE